jgi:bacteriorhodopsin
VILLDEFMIVTGLVGALVKTSYKWGYFVFGCAALGYITYMLVWDARKHANALGKDVGRAFLYCGSLTAFLWILYPIAWGVCEGGNVIAPDSEAVFYGILDLFAKPVFGALLLWGHRNIDPAQLGLRLVDYTGDDMAVSVRHSEISNGELTDAQVSGHHEKKAANGSNGHTNGSSEATPAQTV